MGVGEKLWLCKVKRDVNERIRDFVVIIVYVFVKFLNLSNYVKKQKLVTI